MTGEKIKNVLTRYVTRLGDMGFKPIRCSDGGGRLNHAAWMARKTEEFLDEGRREKAFRWLGFIQGVLWMAGIYSIDEMKRHNMPDDNGE